MNYQRKKILGSEKSFRRRGKISHKSAKFWAKVIVISIAAIVASGILFFFTVWAGFWGKLPGKSELANIENHISSEVYAAGGELLGKYFIYDRTHVNLDQISENVIDCLISTEDIRFYNHNGIDYRSLARVFFRTLLMRESSAGGGSTLSQQLAKNLYARQNNGIFSMPVNKAREMIIARRLEKIYEKDDILLLYLNTVPFGENVFGISAASLRFFNKNPYDLTIEEAAVLVGMLKATSFFNPRRFPERTINRRNVVIGQLVRYELISQAEADSLREIPLQLNYSPFSHNLGPAPYFREKVRQDVVRFLHDYNTEHKTSYNIFTDGLKIHTTLDYELQQLAEKAMKKQVTLQQKVMDAYYQRLPRNRAEVLIKNLMVNSDRFAALQKNKLSAQEIENVFKEKASMDIFSWDGPQSVSLSPWDSIFKMQHILHSGLISIDPNDGHVKAWVGGNDFRFFQFDNVLAKRQPGSVFKPFVYATALEMGIDPCEYVSNEIKIYEEYDEWSPENVSGEHEGYYSMMGALAHSINTVSAYYISLTGVLPVIEKARKAGIHSMLPAVPSIALGTANVSLLEMTAAYATFLNDGYTLDPVWITKIEDKDGNILFNRMQQNQPDKVWEENTVMLTREMLKAVVDSGTAGRLRGQFAIRGDLAGKTGTTQNNADTWFVGFTPGLITGVWTGVENPAFAAIYGSPVSSGTSAVPIWGEYTRTIEISRSARKYTSGHFLPLPHELAGMLDCAMYLDELPTESWWDRLFGTPQDREQRRERRDRERPSRFRRFLESIFPPD